MIRAPIRVNGKLEGGLQALLGTPVAAYSGCGKRDAGWDTARGARRPDWCELAGTFNWPDGGSVADGHRQAGSGMARSWAKARRTFSSHGQRWGRCKVNRRAELVSRPAGQIVRHHLYRQPGAVGGEAARGEMVQPDAVLEVAYRVLHLGVAAMISLPVPWSLSPGW